LEIYLVIVTLITCLRDSIKGFFEDLHLSDAIIQ